MSTNDWLSKRRDEWITIYLSNTIFPDTTRIAMEGAWNAALEALRSSPVEFNKKAASEAASEAAYDTWTEDFELGARWQFDRDRARIALADRDREIALEADDKRWAAERRIAELTEALEWIADTTRREFGHGLSAADICYQLRKRARKALGRNNESAGEK